MIRKTTYKRFIHFIGIVFLCIFFISVTMRMPLERFFSDPTSLKKQDPAIVFSYSSEKVFDDTSRNIVIDPAGNRNFDGRMFFGKDRILFSLHQQQSDSLIHTDYEGDDEHIVIDSRRTVLFSRRVNLYENQIFFSLGFPRKSPDQNSIIKLPLNYTDDDPSQGEWEVFHDIVATQFFIHEGWMYYSNRQGLYKKSMDSNENYLLAKDFAFSINLLDEWLYYIRSTDMHVVKVRTDGSDYQSIMEKETSYLTVDDQHFYFLDANNHLCRSNHEGKEVKTIVAEAVKSFNISDQWIYYQNKNQPWDLIRTRKKGTESQNILLNGGAFLDIFTDGDIAYVMAALEETKYSDTSDTGIYRISDDGAIELFYPKLSSLASYEKVSIEEIKESFEIEAEFENTKKVVDANFEDKAKPKDETSPLAVLYFLVPALGILIVFGILWVKRRKQLNDKQSKAK